MHRSLRFVLSTSLLVMASSAAAQTTTAVPPAAPTIGASGGLGGGIAIPIGALSNTHSAGYTLTGLVDFSAADQPFSFRTELIYQRYDKKSSAPTGTEDMNMWSLGASLLSRSPKHASSAFLLGGIAVYRATSRGTKPGANVGMGLEVPLTAFIGMADIRVHYVLTEGKPLVTIPITLGARF